MSVDHGEKPNGEYSLSFRIVNGSTGNKVYNNQQVTDYALIASLAIVMWSVFGPFAATPCAIMFLRTYFQIADE